MSVQVTVIKAKKWRVLLPATTYRSVQSAQEAIAVATAKLSPDEDYYEKWSLSPKDYQWYCHSRELGTVLVPQDCYWYLDGVLNGTREYQGILSYFYVEERPEREPKWIRPWEYMD